MHYGAYNQAGRLYLDKSYPPLGLGYLAAVLKCENIDVKVIDLVDTPFEKVPDIMKRYNPQIVGVSCNLTDYRWGAFRLATIIKSINPKIKVVFGGSHATHMYKQILQNFPVDVIVRFEGEETFLELVKAIQYDMPLKEVKGIAFKEGQQITLTENRAPIDCLDCLPIPAYLSEFEKYVRYSSPIRFKGKKISAFKSRNIMASRGCPYDCLYCSINRFWHRKCRFRSVDNVVDEIQTLYKEYGVKHFNFFDDAFTLNNAHVIEICQEIINRKLDIAWECVTRVDAVSLEMLQWMKKAGCQSISYGVESGSPLVLNTINKTQTPAQIDNAFKLTHQVGIKAFILLMIGNPGETEASINETIELIRRIKPDKIRTTLTLVYPATGLYEICLKNGFISDVYWLGKDAAPVFTVENSVEQLKQWESKVSFAYYLQKRMVFRLFSVIFYRWIFRNFRELSRRLFPNSDFLLEKIDHVLHQV
jgi:radical SAM superfamily enzyme YgiQ (UPF0313 family)